MRLAFLLSLCFSACSLQGEAQAPPATSLPAYTAIPRAVASSLLSSPVPLHAVMEITGPTPDYTGTVDILSAPGLGYRSIITSPHFSQTRIVNDKQIFEQNTGDYFPRWLQTLATAPAELAVMTGNFAGFDSPVTVGEGNTESCIRRDERPGGITDQMTWGVLCFTGSQPLLASILTFNINVSFADYQPFGAQQIARTYTTDVLDYKPVTGRLVILEKADPDPSVFAIKEATPPADQIRVAFISTPQAQSLYESSPPINWPTVREGRTEGFMIVYARTDRTGQVRETAKHNSEQPGLEEFGMQQALHYKFKPLIIGGIPHEMEMPIVLHFSTNIADALPILTDAETRARMSGRSLPQAKPGQVPFRIRISVDEQGNTTGETYLDANNPSAPHRSSVPGTSIIGCRFAPLVREGKPTYDHGDLLLP